jgi:hypothetical protein
MPGAVDETGDAVGCHFLGKDKHRRHSCGVRKWAVSTRGSNVPVEECFFEGFAGGVEAEGLSGSVVELVGDGVEVGLVAGDLDALG